MSTSKTRAPRKVAGKTVGKPGGDVVSLVIPIPGGQAKFYKPADLTPRRTRDLEVIGAELMPRIQELARAQRVQVEGRVVDSSGVLSGPPVGLTRDELRTFIEFQEATAFAFLESWTLDRPLPETPDDFQDLPRPLYDAIMQHAARLSFTDADTAEFTVDALPDDLTDVDPDLPTSPSAA